MTKNLTTGPGLEPAVLSKADEMRASLIFTSGPVTDQVIRCHVAAWNAGWWHDVKTGNRLDRNAGEMLMLQVSEICEAAQGLGSKIMDDKLPHRPMLEVEMADFRIRLADYCGGLGLDLQTAVNHSERTESLDGVILPENDHTIRARILFRIVRHLAEAMEGHRKGSVERHVMGLARAWRAAEFFNQYNELDVDGAQDEKMAFNKVRPDHQIENRAAAGGKRY